MGRLRLYVWLITWSIVCAGCALPQFAERYHFENEKSTVAYGDRYAGHAENLVHRLEGGTRLEVGACGWSFEEIFRSLGGKRVFGFPIAVHELEELFGPPSRVDRVALMTGHSCF